jgi:hypothetical protein
MALISPASPLSPTPPTPPSPPRRGGGCLIAAGVVIGPIIGLMFGETSVGLLAGLALGVLAAVALTIADGKR